jgi:hypothetical protein
MQLLLSQRRRTIRAPINPMDKATVVSIYPKDIHEIKPTIQPGDFKIQKGSEDNPSFLVVGPSSWWREIDEDQPLLEIPCSALQVADSIIRDFLNGILEYNPDESSPGIFYLPGEVDEAKLRKEHTPSLLSAIKKQKAWYVKLVSMADVLWARTNGNPIAINDDMRFAAQSLGIKDKPWMQDFSSIEMTNCPACGSLRNPAYPMCGACHTIVDKKLYEQLGLSSELRK